MIQEEEYEVYDTWKLKVVHKGTREQCEHYVKGNNVYQANYSKLKINKKQNDGSNKN